MIKAMKPRPVEELMKVAYYMRRWEGPMIYNSSSVMNEKEIVVTGEGYREEDFEGSGFKYIPSLEKAVSYAFAKHGKNASVNVSPYGGRFTYSTADDSNADFADDVIGPDDISEQNSEVK
jgi:hypothetical protein